MVSGYGALNVVSNSARYSSVRGSVRSVPDLHDLQWLERAEGRVRGHARCDGGERAS